MKIGIIGSGMIGSTTARLFAKAGHQVLLSNSRGPATLTSLVEQIGENAQAGTVEEAASFGEMVLVSIPLKSYQTLPAQLLAGKTVIDTMNYYPQRDGTINMNGLSSSGLVAEYLNQSTVVKAFNTMYFQTLATEGSTQKPLAERLVIFLAGDDEQAKAKVAQLIEEIGFAPLDTGSLAESVQQEPGSAVYDHPMTLAEAQKALGKS